MSLSDQSPPKNYAVILFPGFQALDVFGPIDILNVLSETKSLRLSILAPTLDPVSTNIPGSNQTIGQSIVPTHTLDNPPQDVQVLLVPGGKGTRDQELTKPIVDFLRTAYPSLRYLLTVCTGSTLAARAGLLDGRRATSNKLAFEWVTNFGAKVEWVARARWVTDGNIWTSSGISAGIDMMYAFVADLYGSPVAAAIAERSEYTRHLDSADDAFAHLVKQ